MAITFTYKRTTYSLEEALKQLIRQEIKNNGKRLSAIIHSCCPDTIDEYNNDDSIDYQASAYQKPIGKQKRLSIEIKKMQESFYSKKFSSKDRDEITSKVTAISGKSHRIYDFFDLDSMFAYHLLIKNIVDEYNRILNNVHTTNVQEQLLANKIITQLGTTKLNDAQKFRIYEMVRDITLAHTSKNYGYSNLHSCLEQEPIMTNKGDEVIEFLYQQMGLPQYTPQCLEKIVSTYQKHKNLTEDLAYGAILKETNVVAEALEDNKTNHDDRVIAYDPTTGDCLGPVSPQPVYDQQGHEIGVQYFDAEGNVYDSIDDVCTTPPLTRDEQ